MAALPGYGGAVYYAAQTSTSMTNEACTDAGDQLNYTITDTAKRLMDDTATTVVQKDTAGNGVFVTQTAYTINYAIGTITFTSAIGASDVVRVSTGKYFTATQVAEAHEWSLDIEKSLEDDTVFGDTWETSIPVMGKASGSVKLHWADASFLTQLASTTPRLVMVLYVATSGSKRYQFYALLSKDGISAAVKGLVEESIDFTSTGPVNYVAG